MKAFVPVVLLALAMSLNPCSLAQDNVTVPRSRLEELERKERELEQLKGDPNKTQTENTQLKHETPKPVPPPAEPVVTHTSPPISSLPPLKADEIVDSLDLSNYYHADPAVADNRFRHQKLTLRGEIVGFEKPLLIRNYKVLLKTADRDIKVICDLLPPEKSNAVFTTDHGSKLVVLMGETRVPIAKIGDIAVVKGDCKGLHGGAVSI